MSVRARAPNHVSIHRIYGSTLDPKKKWYNLSSQLVGRKVSQFVKGKFFQLFPSEICRVQVFDLWRQNGDHVPKNWFSEKTKNMEEAFGITLFGLCGGLIKQSSTESDWFLSSDLFKRVMEAINNIYVEEGDTGLDTSFPDGQACAQTPKSRKIEILERELEFYQEKVRDIESSIVVANLETPPNTPGVCSPRSIDLIASSKVLGPINKRRQLKSLCSKALEQISSASSHGTLGTVLGYGYIYGREEHHQLAKSAVLQAVEIVAENKGMKSALEFAFSPKIRQRQESAWRVPDWVQLYVKLEVKLPDNGWQTVLNFLNLGRSGVSFLCCKYTLFLFLYCFSGPG